VGRDRASRPGASPLRLFVAVEVPEAAKEVVARAIEPWRAVFPRARWAPAQNWHVTLKFLGATYPRLVGWVEERLVDVAAGSGPVPTRIAGAGAFPTAASARVLWAGLDDPDGRLASLASAVEAALQAEFAPESRPFTPHLTVARSDPPMRPPEGLAVPEVRSEPFTVGELVLFRSHLHRPAPTYEALRRLPLKG
jgi:2'-5' RNA ligase